MLFKPVHNGNRKRYSYARIKEVLKMPHLIDLQRNPMSGSSGKDFMTRSRTYRLSRMLQTAWN